MFVVLLLQLSYITHDELHIPAEVKTKVADVVNCFLFVFFFASLPEGS